MELFPSPSTSYGPPPSIGLPPTPKPLETKRPIAWLGDDGRNVFVEIQGRLACIAFRKGPLSYTPSPRGEVQGFSAASRLRMLKTINRLDFERAGRCTFMTTTWRDEIGRPEPEEITRARSAFQKSIERMAGTELPGIWRVEWQQRQSGRYRGSMMPHVHVIYFNIPYLEVEEVTEAWARSIRYAGRVSCKLKEIKNLRMCLYYVSKYVAKLDDLCNLDIASYLAKHRYGRKWGIYRKNRLPVADKLEIRVFPGKLIDEIREIAIRAYDKTPVDKETGFCVFGPASQEISQLCEKYCLTMRDELVI